jgi:hypothetical protein
MLNDEQRKILGNVVNALESEWFKTKAASEKEESRALARKRFETARVLIRQSRSDSEVLEALLSVLEAKEKTS